MKHSPRTWNVLLGLGQMRMGVSQPRKTEMISPTNIQVHLRLLVEGYFGTRVSSCEFPIHFKSFIGFPVTWKTRLSMFQVLVISIWACRSLQSSMRNPEFDLLVAFPRKEGNGLRSLSDPEDSCTRRSSATSWCMLQCKLHITDQSGCTSPVPATIIWSYMICCISFSIICCFNIAE